MKKLFYLMLALPFVFAACTETPDEPTPAPSTKLSLKSDATMNFEAKGGEGTILYTLENAKEGVELTATCEADWVVDVTVGTTINFNVEANEGEARETKVVVAYDTLSFEVVVKQAAKADEPKTPVFEPEVDVVEFDCTEQEGEIAYTLEDPVQGVTESVKTNASWISDLEAKNGNITFTVAANAGDAREGKITAEYGVLNFSVTVKQSEYVAPAPKIVLDATSVEFMAEGGEATAVYEIQNAVEGVELTATTANEWITVVSVADGVLAYTVAAYEGEVDRDGKITLTYGDVTAELAVKQYRVGYDPDLNYGTFKITGVKAKARDNNVWDITLSEKDGTLGEMWTRISVQLPEKNAMYITEGTYTVANGGILVNEEYVNSNSIYRYNFDGGENIIDCELTVTIDTENEKAILSGNFTAGSSNLTFSWDGAVDGFMYKEIGDEGITEWDRFIIRNKFGDQKNIYGILPGGDVSSPFVEFAVIKMGSTKDDPIAPGTYNVDDWEWEATHDRVCRDAGGINGNRFASGTLVIEEVDGGYKLTFDVIDVNGTQWKGSYTGEIPYEPYEG